MDGHQSDAGVIAAERSRASAILEMPESVGREALALHLASLPEMHVDMARKFLQAAVRELTLPGALIGLGYAPEPFTLEGVFKPVIERPTLDSCFAAAGRGMQ